MWHDGAPNDGCFDDVPDNFAVMVEALNRVMYQRAKALIFSTHEELRRIYWHALEHVERFGLPLNALCENGIFALIVDVDAIKRYEEIQDTHFRVADVELDLIVAPA